MNSYKKSSYFQESEAFTFLQDQIEDQELLIQLKKIEGNYYQLLQQNDRRAKKKVTKESSHMIAISSFNKHWQKVYDECQLYFYNESLSFNYSSIKRCISRIHEVFLRLSSVDSYPRDIKKRSSHRYDDYDNSNEEEGTYEHYITKFKEDFLKLKQVFNLKQYSQNFVITFKKFLKKIPKYNSIFSEANIDQNELSDLISIMQKMSNRIGNIISSIENTQIPSELDELDEIIRHKIDEIANKSEENDDFNNNNYDDDNFGQQQRKILRKSAFVSNRKSFSPSKNAQKMANSFRQPYNDDFKDSPSNSDKFSPKHSPRTSTRSELLEDINSCSNRLKNISNSIDSKLDEESENENKDKKMMKFLQLMQDQINSESRFLETIQKVDIVPEKVRTNSELQNERQRNKMIFEILNKGQSALAEDIDTDKLKRLNNDQLISIILSLCIMIKDKNGDDDESNENSSPKKNYKLQIPLELTLCKGTHEEFKRLSQQYFKTAQYNEWAEREIKKLSSSNIQLKSDNEILSSQLNSKENEYKLLNELRKIDDRIQNINSELEQKLQTNSQFNRKNPAQSLETTDLNGEIEDLAKKKKKIKANLKKIIPNELLNEIESLNIANARLKVIADARMREVEDLQKQIMEFSNEAVKLNRNGQYFANNNNQNPNFSNFNNGNRGNRYVKNNDYDDQEGNFLNRSGSSPNKSAKKLNRSANGLFNDDDDFVNEPSNSNFGYGNNFPPSQINGRRRINAEFNDQSQTNRQGSQSAKPTKKLNRNDQFDREFGGQNEGYSPETSKFAKNGQIDDDQEIGYGNNRSFTPLSKNKKLLIGNQSNSNLNRSGQINSQFSRSNNFDNDESSRKPMAKSNLQGQNRSNKNVNQLLDNFEEEEYDTNDDAVQNYNGNRNRSNKNVFNDFEDDNDYQNESEKKIKPRMRK